MKFANPARICALLLIVGTISSPDAFSGGMQSRAAEELYNLGAATYFGMGTEANQQLACEYFADAADLGHPKAVFNLGNCYREGAFGVVNIDRAEELYIEAAGRGVANAFVSLGVLHLSDDEEFASYKAANQFLRIALYSEPDNPVAAYHLGVSFLLGRGISKDWNRGFELIEKSSESGVLYALATIRYLNCTLAQTNSDDNEECRVLRSEYDFIRSRSSQTEPTYEETVRFLLEKGWLPTGTQLSKL